jgi:hypothetical protein
MAATEAEREAAAMTVAASLAEIVIVMIVETSIVVVVELALVQGPQMMTDIIDPEVADLAVMMTDLAIGLAVVIETGVADDQRVQNALEANLRLLSPLKTSGIVVQSSFNNLLLVLELKSL